MTHTKRHQKAKYHLIKLDVCGNAKEGFTVNNFFQTDTIIEVTGKEYSYNENTDFEFLRFVVSDENIIRALKREGLIKKNIRLSDILIDGCAHGTLYVERSKTYEPLYHLECITKDLFNSVYVNPKSDPNYVL